jgi:plastocyanin
VREVRVSSFELGVSSGGFLSKLEPLDSNLHPRTWLVSVISLLLLAAARPATAQTTVSGVVALEEQPGAARGDIRGAVVYLESLSQVMHVSDVPSLRMGTIVMRGREFLPHVRVVLAGGTVAFPNEDPFRHNVFSSAELGPFDLGLYPRGATRSASFARPGAYPIYCNIHSRMVSFVVAVPTRWATHPEEDGRFILQDVRPGPYILHAWHERGTAEVTREIVVPTGGLADLRLTIDARSYVPTPHLNKFGRPYSLIRSDRY